MPTVKSKEFLLINIILVITDTSMMVEGQGVVSGAGCQGEVKPYDK